MQMIYRSDIEIWKPIPGYEGIYEASSQGRIRTAEGKTTYTERHGVRSWQQRVLRQKYLARKGNKGNRDARVCLWKDGKDKTFLVARLIAMTFHPAPFDKLTVNHIDGNPMNNSADNLEWVTHAENNRLGFEMGLFCSVQKKVILTDADGHELTFASMAEASRYLGRNNGYVSDALAKGLNCYDKCGVKYSVRLSESGDAELN